jgi:hypothetical protein
MKYLLAIILSVYAPAQAGPRDWIRHHPTAIAFITGGTAATVHGLGLRHCRQGSVEHCQARYGAAWASFGAATVTNFAVIGASSGCWKDQDQKFCSLFQYSGSAAQLGFGIQQWRAKGTEEGKR